VAPAAHCFAVTVLWDRPLLLLIMRRKIKIIIAICNAFYALTSEAMRRELIIEAAQLRVKAKAN